VQKNRIKLFRSRFSNIVLCLRVPELKILAALFFEQLLVAAELDEPAAVEHRDLVAEATHMS